MDKMNVNEMKVQFQFRLLAVNLSGSDEITGTGMRLVSFFSQQAPCES